jgi:SAM-dependent methyltransferase
MDWKRFWNTDPRVLSGNDLLVQVGKTVNGTPIRQQLLDVIAAQIVEKLEIGPGEDVLDLCCGNGIITRRYAPQCRSVHAIDFSEPLIEAARLHCGLPNISYRLGDVCALPDDIRMIRFDKILMYEALQNFQPEQAEALFAFMANSASDRAPIFIASVPDREDMARFYDTDERRAAYAKRVADNNDRMGRWWLKMDLADICAAHGYSVEFSRPHESLPVSHYRFDALCRPLRASPTASVD